MLTLYTNQRSRGRIAQWMVEETGAECEMIELDYGAPMRTPEFLALNPMGKVPVLTEGDTVVTEVAAICAWLAERFPEADLAPRPDARAEYYRWMFFAAGPLEAAVTARALGIEPPPERRQMVGYGDFDSVIGALEQKLGRDDFIAGGRFTAADVYVGSHIAWGLQFGSLPTRPAFEAYRDRLAARPAFGRAIG